MVPSRKFIVKKRDDLSVRLKVKLATHQLPVLMLVMSF